MEHEYSFDAVRRGALPARKSSRLSSLYEYSFDAVRRGAQLNGNSDLPKRANEYSFDAVRRGALDRKKYMEIGGENMNIPLMP